MQPAPQPPPTGQRKWAPPTWVIWLVIVLAASAMILRSGNSSSGDSDGPVVTAGRVPDAGGGGGGDDLHRRRMDDCHAAFDELSSHTENGPPMFADTDANRQRYVGSCVAEYERSGHIPP
jgi:hypothetical protein